MQIDWDKYPEKKAKDIAAKFGAETVAEMVFNLGKLGMKEQSELIRSLKSSIRMKDGVIDRIEFKYNFYGRFFEHGATNVFGKGVTISASKWRTRAIEAHKEELNQEFSELYAGMILSKFTIDDIKLSM